MVFPQATFSINNRVALGKSNSPEEGGGTMKARGK